MKGLVGEAVRKNKKIFLVRTLIISQTAEKKFFPQNVTLQKPMNKWIP